VNLIFLKNVGHGCGNTRLGQVDLLIRPPS